MTNICSNCAQELPPHSMVCQFCGCQHHVQAYAEPQQQAYAPQQAYAEPQQQYQQPPPQAYAPQQAFAPQPQYQQPQYQQHYTPAPPPQPQYQQPQYQQPYAPIPPPQPQYQQPQYQQPQYQQSQYSPMVATKPKKTGKVVAIFLIIFVLLAGAGAAVYFFILNPASTATPEASATTWVNSLLEGDIAKALRHTALGDEMIDLSIRQGFASSRDEAIRDVEYSIFGDISSDLLYIGLDFIDFKIEVASSTEVTASRRDSLLRDLRYLANTGDYIFDNAVHSLCDSITEITQIGLGMSVFGFSLPTESFLSVYVAQIDGKWFVLPLGW